MIAHVDSSLISTSSRSTLSLLICSPFSSCSRSSFSYERYGNAHTLTHTHTLDWYTQHIQRKAVWKLFRIVWTECQHDILSGLSESNSDVCRSGTSAFPFDKRWILTVISTFQIELTRRQKHHFPLSFPLFLSVWFPGPDAVSSSHKRVNNPQPKRRGRMKREGTFQNLLRQLTSYKMPSSL